MKDKLRILVVDDDLRMLKTIHDILVLKGYEAIIANSGEKALEKISSAMPDCVFMDIKMQGIDGIETMKVIRRTFSCLPVVLMSAYVTEQQVLEAEKHGVYAVLHKPIDIQAVLVFLALLRKEKNIFIVDDDLDFCKTIKDILELRGYKVETEVNPEKVLGDIGLVEDRSIVLLDLKLGKMNGVDVLKDIRTKYPSQPVIMVTGYGEEMADSIAKGLRIGAYTCLYKPLEIDKLIKKINEIDSDRLRTVLGESA